MVSIPFKRESALQVLCENHRPPSDLFCFNSLQTGKCIASWLTVYATPPDRSLVSIPFKRESGSQVSYVERGNAETVVSIPFKRESGSQEKSENFERRNLTSVSIPFKRESGSQVSYVERGNAETVVSIPFKRESGSQVMQMLLYPTTGALVSIPFKRESGSQGPWAVCIREHYGEFQFPSNGKVDLKRRRWSLLAHTLKVSIPFKRESGSQVEPVLRDAENEFHKVSIPFKRESGSQVNDRETLLKWVNPVSIPFKRESGSQARTSISFRDRSVGVSIPFKRESGSQVEYLQFRIDFTISTVSIPFKRESVSQASADPNYERDIQKVSIPFKRESGSQVLCQPTHSLLLAAVSIPFKRESVSQAHIIMPADSGSWGFNSLQTGKCISRWRSQWYRGWAVLCFNSLQTGKCISRQYEVSNLSWNYVSIPFKRESGSQGYRRGR